LDRIRPNSDRCPPLVLCIALSDSRSSWSEAMKNSCEVVSTNLLLSSHV
jgi:hypothetical protein